MAWTGTASPFCLYVLSYSLQGSSGETRPAKIFHVLQIIVGYTHYPNYIRLLPRCKWDLRSSAMLRIVYWKLPAFWDSVSVPFSGVKQSENINFLTDSWRLSWNVGNFQCTLRNALEVRSSYPNQFAALCASLSLVFNCRCKWTVANFIRLRSCKLFFFVFCYTYMYTVAKRIFNVKVIHGGDMYRIFLK
jgi:hypothetical protein